jgi:hypothetical protein
MRNLINFIALMEADTFTSAANLNKNPDRFENLLDMIRTGKDIHFYDKKTGEKDTFVADASEADRLQELYDSGKFAGSIAIRAIATGEMISLGTILKTSELGGHAAKGGEEGKGEAVGKEAALLKPKQIGITNKDIPASKLGDIIINNEVLQSTDYGKAVIEMAKTIMSGQDPVVPNFPEKITKSIVDYAGEYLGVLSLVLGGSNFPKRKEFEEWLGAETSALVVNFPDQSNLALADSIAVPMIKNASTQHSVYISSKGTGGGAAPAISGLRVPDDVRNDSQYEAAVAFIDLCNNDIYKRGTATTSSAFAGMNLLYEYAPDKIPDKFMEFLPWDIDQITKEVTENRLAFNAKDPDNATPMPEYENLWSDTNFTKPSSDGGKLIYAVKKAVIDAINKNDAIPNFKDTVLMVLDMNFVQQYADLTTKSRELKFATQWPARLEGKVKIESKSSAGDPVAGGFSFKLSRTDEEITVPKPDEGPQTNAKTASEKDFAKKAGDIALGKNRDTAFDKTPDSMGNAGRKKR